MLIVNVKCILQLGATKSRLSQAELANEVKKRTTIKLSRTSIGRRHDNVCYCHGVDRRVVQIVVLIFVGEFGLYTSDEYGS